MKKWYVLILTVVFLNGCGAQPTFETIDDDQSLLVSATIRQISLALPKEAAKPTMESSGGSLYICNGYTLAIETFSGGNLNRTVQQITGYTLDRVQYMKTGTADIARYDLVWTTAGEGGDQVARAVILDDGFNHYVVSVMAEAAIAGDLQDTWQTLLSSVTLRTD